MIPQLATKSVSFVHADSNALSRSTTPPLLEESSGEGDGDALLDDPPCCGVVVPLTVGVSYGEKGDRDANGFVNIGFSWT